MFLLSRFNRQSDSLSIQEERFSTAVVMNPVHVSCLPRSGGVLAIEGYRRVSLIVSVCLSMC